MFDVAAEMMIENKDLIFIHFEKSMTSHSFFKSIRTIDLCTIHGSVLAEFKRNFILPCDLTIQIFIDTKQHLRNGIF